MYDHITLRVRDFQASLRFYTAAVAPLGIELSIEDGTSAAFGDRHTFLPTSGREPTANVHVAFRAGDRDAVDAFYAAALANGGSDNGPPGIRTHFVFDPDGNNIDAVCMT